MYHPFRTAALILLAGVLALLLTPAPSATAATTFFVDDNCPGPLYDGSALDPFCDIQTAVDAAPLDNKVILVAPGAYSPFGINTQVNVQVIKDPTVVGDAFIHYTAVTADPGNLINVDNSANILIEGFYVEGDGKLDVDAVDFGMSGIHYNNSSGIILGNHVTGLVDSGDPVNFDDPKLSTAYWMGGITAWTDSATPLNLLIQGNTVDTYDDSGIDINGNFKVKIDTVNVITGGGSDEDNEFGIQVGDGVIGTIANNYISDMDGMPSGDRQGTGIQIWQSNKVKVVGNTIDEVAFGIRIDGMCSALERATANSNKITGNTITDVAADGTGINIHIGVNSSGTMCDPTASFNKIANNYMENVGDGNATWVTGVRIDTHDDDGFNAGYLPIASFNSIKGNTFIGFDVAVDDHGTMTKTSNNVLFPFLP